MRAAMFTMLSLGLPTASGLVVPTASGLVAPTVGRRCAAPQCMAAALEPGDKVAVVGASGNVGKLVTLRLSDSFKVTGISRNPSRVRDFLPSDKVELAEAEPVGVAVLQQDGEQLGGVRLRVLGRLVQRGAIV